MRMENGELGMNKLVLLAVKYLLIAIKKFYDSDYKIFRLYKKNIEGMERACAFRIGSYFREMIENQEIVNFYGYTVDMEYNRQGEAGEPKCLHQENSNIFPDLIFHRRGKPDNMLVCEFKVMKDASDTDCNKLEKMTKIKQRCCKSYACGYRIGLFVGLEDSLEKIKIVYFLRGKQIDKAEFYKKFVITEEEQAFLENIIKSMEINGELKTESGE